MVFLRVNIADRGMKGVSLVETLVVVVIISVMLKFAISMFNTYRENTNLREAAGALAADMKLAKQRAVAENVNYTITFSVTNNKYEIQGPSGCCSTCATHCTYDVTKTLSSFGAGVKILSQNFISNIMTAETRGTCSGITGTSATVTLQNSINSKKIIITIYTMGKVAMGAVTS